MTTVELVTAITAERLRIDSPERWADAQPAWLDYLLGEFYLTKQAAERGILLIAKEFLFRIGGTSELSVAEARELADLTQSVRILIERFSNCIAKTATSKQPPRDFRVAAPASQSLNGAKEGHTEVRVFYGTDRQESLTADGWVVYTHERAEGAILNFGECIVTVPRCHKVGALESPSFLHFEFTSNPQKHIILRSTLKKSEADFLRNVAAAVEKSPNREAFIFVHGYNVSFETCARRTAQIAFDLKFSGAAIFYSWPSNARILDYIVDEANAAWTVPHFDRFLTLILLHSGAARLHVIAHSMGNRPVCDALLRIASRTKYQGTRLQELILAAPDIDSDTFRQMAEAIQTCAERVTLYASSKDKALELSCKLHGYKRAGTPILILPGVDSIDASAVNTDFLAHSYFCEDRSVLSDIYNLIRVADPPEYRFDLSEVRTASGKYFIFRN